MTYCSFASPSARSRSWAYLEPGTALELHVVVTATALVEYIHAWRWRRVALAAT